ncbi:MAG: ABC transporter permease [Bacteroidales bacterium]|nr:ABC transporter permease [Bacteroidales bacterium]
MTIVKRTIIYEPNSRQKTGFVKIYFILFKNILNNRELIFQLFKRDFLMSYKKSFLGMGWLIFTPILGIASWVFLNFSGILAPGDVGTSYTAYVIVGTSLWGLFMSIYNGSSQTLNTASSFIMQVKFPHDILVIKEGLQQMTNFAIIFIINIIVLLLVGVVPSWKIIFLPLFLIPIFLAGASIGLLVSMLSVIAFDLQKIFTFLMGLLMYLTPIIYSNKLELKSYDTLHAITTWNPMTYLICEVRNLIIHGRIEFLDRYFYSALFVLFVFLLSWRTFYVSEQKVIEKIL